MWFRSGYIDYEWFVELTRQGVYWVTRLKDNANYLVVERRPVPAGSKVLTDEIICFYGLLGEDREYFFRRVEIFDAEQQRRLVFFSIHLQFGPTTTAAIYKERWQVGVSGQGHINQSVKVRPRRRDSGLVAWEAPWRESKTAMPSDNRLGKEHAQLTRLQRTVNAEVPRHTQIRWLRRSTMRESNKSRPKRVRCGGSHRRGISGDMVGRRMCQLEKPSVPGEESSPKK